MHCIARLSVHVVATRFMLRQNMFKQIYPIMYGDTQEPLLIPCAACGVGTTEVTNENAPLSMESHSGSAFSPLRALLWMIGEMMY